MSTTRYDSRLIQRPQNVPLVRRTFWGVVTAAFWAIYIYLWIPLLTLVAWFFGLREGWAQLYHGGQQIEPFVVVALPLIFLGCALVLILWGEYNRRRFRGRDRRRPLPQATDEEVARGLGALPELGRELGQARIATVVMDERARPVGVAVQALSRRE